MLRGIAASARDQAKLVLTRSPRAYSALRRPYAIARFALRQPHGDSYGVFGLFAGDGLFLDVGANAGQSAFAFRIFNRRSPILSIEPNPFHEPDLRFAARIVRRMTYSIMAASDQEGTMTLFIPTYRHVPLSAFASLSREDLSKGLLHRAIGARSNAGEFEIQEQEVPVRTLDHLNVDPAYIKVDVEGHEYQALNGLRETIARAQPVLLVETPAKAVDGLLAEHGYRPYRFLAEDRTVVERGSHRDVGQSPDTVFLLDRHIAEARSSAR